LRLDSFPPTIVCWGAIETDQFKQQSRVFAQAIRDGGSGCLDFEIADRNHFDVILDLADPAAVLGQHVGRMVNAMRS
jgi:arylformamidase